MPAARHASLGLDFGTESVRALVVDTQGKELASSVARFKHGQITQELPVSGERLPAQFALQHPGDWLASAARAARTAVRRAAIDPAKIVSVGVDFTSCTMLPALADGAPLCTLPDFAAEKYAWPKLWKHHGAVTETERLNRVARDRGESWLARYGGVVGLEWFFPKILETLAAAPHVYEAAEVWLEAGDWLVWQLTGSKPGELVRSTCQAGYKGLWSREEGFPSPEFFAAVDRRLGNVVAEKMPGRLASPGEPAGVLDAKMARRLGLPPGAAVSTAVIDAHAGVPGAGVSEAGALVLVLGTSSCHMLCANELRTPQGLAGVAWGGILPGYYGYETGQAAVGDAFDWLRRLVGQRNFKQHDARAALVPPGSRGVLALDWLNGCRTPLMDGRLRGAFAGLSLEHEAADLYRALLEGSAFGLRWIVDLLADAGLPIERVVATGGLPHHNPLLIPIYADVLGRPIEIAAARQGPALGAAVLGVVAAGKQAGGFDDIAEAVAAMSAPRARGPRRNQVVRPHEANTVLYERHYARYRELAATMSEPK